MNRQNALEAYKDIFKMWKVSLLDAQKKKLQKVYFKAAWDKFNENGSLNVKDSYSFMR